MTNILNKGKALYVDNDTLYIAKGYKIFRQQSDGSLLYDGKVMDGKYAFLSSLSRLLNRLLRIEVSTLLLLKDGKRLVVAKKGIFIAQKGSQSYVKTFHFPRGNKALNLSLHPNGTLYFGEYFLNGRFADHEREEVHIYKSEDEGMTWSICYTFPKNTIRHIHGVFYDSYMDRIWVTTGDRDNECLIAYTDNDFKTVEVFKEGLQKYRAVTLLFYEKYIVYGTDTEHEKNHIYAINRVTKEERCLQELDGSVLMATQADDQAAISTAVEPSEVNRTNKAYVWYSQDGLSWQNLFFEQKDNWSAKYFQYGRISFPFNAIQHNKIVFSAHALKKLDNKVISSSLPLNK